MLLVKDFKQKYGLSDSSFRRLVTRAKEVNPGVEFTKRHGSKDWELLNEDLISAELTEDQRRCARSVQSNVKVLSPLSDEPFTTGAMVVAPKIDVVSANGYGKRFDFGSQIQELHFHVHTSNASTYEQQKIAADESVQNLIDAALEHAEHQGLEDSREIESIVQAVKSELIKTRVKSAVSGKSVSPDGSNDSAGSLQ